MNATNRAVNRAVLAVVGVGLALIGALVVTASSWSVIRDGWTQAWSATLAWMKAADRGTRISESTTVSWFVVGVLAVLLLIVILVIVIIARLGGGRSSTVVRVDAAGDLEGSVSVEKAFASDAITGALAGRDEILSARVSAATVHGTEVLQVSVTPRKNVSPSEVAATVTHLMENFAILTGRVTPTLVSIRSGVRTRVSAEKSRVN